MTVRGLLILKILEKPGKVGKCVLRISKKQVRNLNLINQLGNSVKLKLVDTWLQGVNKSDSPLF